MGVKEDFYKTILYNQSVKNMVIKLFTSNITRKNPFYQHFHKKKVLSVMDKYYSKPLCVKIENTNACNSNCIMCPHHKMKRKLGFIDEKLFRKIVDECAELGVEHLSMHNFGEPTLDKNFAKKVKYAKKKGIKRVSTNTNASCLYPKVAKALLEAGIDNIYISLDALSKNTFKKIRRGLNYDTVMENVHALAEMKKKNPKYKTEIVLDFVEMDENKHETKAFKKYWTGKVDNVCISCLHNWGGQTKKTTGVHETFVSASGAPCRLLWTDLVIDWDGKVPLCCQDTDENLLIGDVNKQSIKEIWQSKKLNSLRYLHMVGKFNEIPMCSGCKLNTFWWLF